MNEALATNKNEDLKISRRTKLASAVLAAAMAGSIGLYIKTGVDPENSFKTDIPVPKASQPHLEYTVKAGDTESGIAVKFGHDNDYRYMNMINDQLPEADQHDRNLRPGENILLPKE